MNGALLAYIGRYFHGLAPQPNVETVYSYISNTVGRIRFYSRTDKGVNAIANPVLVERHERFITDFVILWGHSYGKPSWKEYRYFMPRMLLDEFEEFSEMIPHKIKSIALTPRPRKEYQILSIGLGDDYVSFRSSGFENYAIRRIMGYFIRYLKGKLRRDEIRRAFNGYIRSYPPTAPPEPLVLWRTDSEEDPYNERPLIEGKIVPRARFRSKILLDLL